MTLGKKFPARESALTNILTAFAARARKRANQYLDRPSRPARESALTNILTAFAARARKRANQYLDRLRGPRAKAR